MMYYKPGEKVMVKTSLEDEECKSLSGKIVTIKEVHDGEGYYTIEENPNVKLTDRMIYDYNFTFGEVIQVSNDGEFWEERIFVAHIPNALYPYCVVSVDDERTFRMGEPYKVTMFKYAKPLK